MAILDARKALGLVARLGFARRCRCRCSEEERPFQVEGVLNLFPLALLVGDDHGFTGLLRHGHAAGDACLEPSGSDLLSVDQGQDFEETTREGV